MVVSQMRTDLSSLPWRRNWPSAAEAMQVTRFLCVWKVLSRVWEEMSQVLTLLSRDPECNQPRVALVTNAVTTSPCASIH